MALAIRPLKPSPNWDIMNAVRADMDSQYQARIPEATQANMQDTVQRLLSCTPQWNEFMDALVNQIGLILVHNTVWTNPLREFKQGLITYGDTIEEVKVGLLKAHSYDSQREALEGAIFGTERPEVQTNFHRINREDMYKITINELLLRRAFLTTDGLSGFVAELMNAPATSDSWDEFLLTCQLFQEYEKNGGFYKVQVPDVKSINSGAADAKRALRELRALAKNMTFLSTKYNAAHMPTFAREEDLLIFVTPEFEAAMDVEALAAAFNLGSAVASGRIISIPEGMFGIEGAQAIVTTRKFFVIGDTLFETRSAENPVALHRNYFLHHHSIISASRFVPAVLLTTKPGTADEQVITPVTGISNIVVRDRNEDTVTTVLRGQSYSLDAEAVTEGVNDAVRWSVEGNTSSRTSVFQDGVLKVSSLEGAETITVRATTVWINPDSDQETEYTTTRALTVSGQAYPDWPVNPPTVQDGATPAE